jgi:DNA repair exonuclease SbcCD ATPase subunit
MSIRQFIADVMELPKTINAVNETIGGEEMNHTLDEVTEKLERACRRIDELQEKNLRLAEKNNSLIKDSIKAQEILTNESAAYDEREDLKRRLQNAELLIERMKDELSLAKGKEECLYQNFKKGNALYLAENLRSEKFQDALLQIRHLTWKDFSVWYDRKRLCKVLLNVFSIAYSALKVEDPYDKANGKTAG